MSRAHFVFREHWVLRRPRCEVHEVLADLGCYPLWWPQVRAVARLGPDDAWVRCRSALPYTLDLVLHADHRSADLLQTTLSGDLAGTARWRLAESDGGLRTVVDYEQEVVVAHPALAQASRAVRPVLRWNHHRMMLGCRAGLERRLSLA